MVKNYITNFIVKIHDIIYNIILLTIYDGDKPYGHKVHDDDKVHDDEKVHDDDKFHSDKVIVIKIHIKSSW